MEEPMSVRIIGIIWFCFGKLKRFLTHRDVLGTAAVLINIWGNVAMGIPLGFAVPLLFPSMQRPERTIILAFLASLLAETFQSYFAGRLASTWMIFC